jgi:hypothetical protein
MWRKSPDESSGCETGSFAGHATNRAVSDHALDEQFYQSSILIERPSVDSLIDAVCKRCGTNS